MEDRANQLIKDLEASIKQEESTIKATQSDDRKIGCKMRIDMAKWGINLCNFIISGKV
jgi:hypothetical protein